ncbi:MULTISPECIES: VOC family protein [Streptomyces violaceusniger group]|uniref:VOC family protein n=1 Tax=Streptomyces rhizosphaericus TaxID=114699 RepID=A0ABN1SQX9_9ACTN|nr:VOC family protein [Streptomyces indonesiensis]
MALHRLTSLTMGVPNAAETAAYYTEFGLTPADNGWFASQDGGRQLRIVQTPTRRLVEIRIGADTPDDLAAAASRLHRLGIDSRSEQNRLTAHDKATGVRAVLEVTPGLVQAPVRGTAYNGPGRHDRTGARAPGVLRTDPVRPRKLGHVVLGTLDFDATTVFFRDGLGFKASDYIKDQGAFLRCSTDHHNVLVLAAPIAFLHHTSWQVDDIDDVGRGAAAMLEDHSERHVWGLGRHHAGSNFFWYLKDPAGNFSEYYSDMDCIVDDQLWTPEVLEGAKGLFSWGPPPPPSFLSPDDLAGLMTDAHSTPR